MYQFLIIAYLFTFHYDKTTCMAFKTRHKTRQTPNLDIHIEDNMLKQVDKQKLLGDFIDEKLSWTAHIDYLCATISSKASLLKQLSSYVPVEIKKIFLSRLYSLGKQLQTVILNGYQSYKKHNLKRGL